MNSQIDSVIAQQVQQESSNEDYIKRQEKRLDIEHRLAALQLAVQLGVVANSGELCRAAQEILDFIKGME